MWTESSSNLPLTFRFKSGVWEYSYLIVESVSGVVPGLDAIDTDFHGYSGTPLRMSSSSHEAEGKPK